MLEFLLAISLSLGFAWSLQRDTCRQADRMSFYRNWYRLFRDIRKNPEYDDLDPLQIDALGDHICYDLYDPLTKKQIILRSILPILFWLSVIVIFFYLLLT